MNNQSKRRVKEYEELLEQREREDQLKHHGVKGMKWGVRRFQPYTDSNKRKGGKGGVFKGRKDRKAAKAADKKKRVAEARAFGVKAAKEGKGYKSPVKKLNEKLGDKAEKYAKNKAAKKQAKRQKVLDGRASDGYVMSEAEDKKMAEIQAKHTDKNGNLDFKAFQKDWNTNHHGKYKPDKYTVPDAKKIYDNAPRKEKKALREKAYKHLMNDTSKIELDAIKNTTEVKNVKDRVKAANDYIKKNQSKLPEGVKIEYFEDHTTSENTPLATITYKGKKVNFGDKKSEGVLEYIGWNLDKIEQSDNINELVNDQFLKHGIDLGEFYDRES